MYGPLVIIFCRCFMAWLTSSRHLENNANGSNGTNGNG